MVAAPPPLPDLLHDLAGAKADILDLLAERAAIVAEPELPPLGKPERERQDEAQRVVLAGLMAAAKTRPLGQ